MNPWEMGKQLAWDVTVVDALALSCRNQGSLCNPGTTATEAEARKIEKYREIKKQWIHFRNVALEVQCSLGKSSEILFTRLCKMLYCSHDHQRAGSFFEATDFNGSSDWQCDLCSRNCQRQICVRKKVLHIGFF